MDAQIEDLARKALSLKDENTSTVWRLIGGAIVAIGVWWLKYQLDKKNAELAQLRLAARVAEVEAEKHAAEAELAGYTSVMQYHRALAAEALKRAKDLAEKAAAAEAAHRERVLKLRAVEENDWDTLNQIAGIR